MADLVLLASYASRAEAVVAHSLLQAQGVVAHMPDANVLMADMDPSFMQSGWRLLVHEDAVDEALEILRDAQQQA